MAVIGVIMVMLGLYNAKFVPSEKAKDAAEKPDFKQTMIDLGNVFVDLFRKNTLLIIYASSSSIVLQRAS